MLNIKNEFIENKYTLVEFLKKNNLYESKYEYITYSGTPIGPSKKISINISKTNFDEKSTELISNPVMIFELDEDKDNEFEFDIDFILDSIELSIGGSQIDKLYDEQIKMYNKIYGLDIKKIGSKVFYPIPFASMNIGNGILSSKCKYHEIRLLIEFSSNKFIGMINSLTIRTELIILSEFLDFSIINNSSSILLTNYYNDYFDKLMIPNQNDENKQIVKINQNQFTGIDSIPSNLSSIKIKICFNHYVNKFFIYFQNLDDKSIYWNTKQFETIKFIANGYDVLEYDYQTLLDLNSKNVLGYELPKGIFEIKWNVDVLWKNLSRVDNLTVLLDGLSVPSNVGFGICADYINWLSYEENQCRIYFSS
jgi:hypothetical protein